MSRYLTYQRVSDLPKLVGKEVELRGWIADKTDKGRLYFLRFRDGSGFCQCVVFQPNVTPETFAAVREVTQESSVVLRGIVRQDARAPGGYEVDVREFRILQRAQGYPITPKEHGVEFLLEHRHLWLRSPRQHAIMRVRAAVIRAICDFLDSRGFVRIDAPILTASACEGTTTLFELEYFDLGKAYLSQSGQLYAEAAAMAHGRVYTLGPTFRAERSKTRRHLTEFWMVEPEAAFFDLEDDMDLTEDLVEYIVRYVLSTAKPSCIPSGATCASWSRCVVPSTASPTPRRWRSSAAKGSSSIASCPMAGRCWRTSPGARISAHHRRRRSWRSSKSHASSTATRQR
jgi:asparaginyl-tRNA synthetase